MDKVIFKRGSSAQYIALQEKDANTLYWLDDTQELYLGDTLYGTGKVATVTAKGLLSEDDKKRLDELVSGSITGITAGDNSITIANGEGPDDAHLKKVSVKISSADKNALSIKDDGLFAEDAEYTIEREDGGSEYAAIYKLKKTTTDGSSEQVGEAINIPKDLMIESGSLKTVSTPEDPYPGAEVGDPYLDIVLNDASKDHIYIPVKDLLDPPAAGNGISVEDYKVSIKIDDTSANGLSVSETGLALAEATEKTAGAMSSKDKLTMDGLKTLYQGQNFEIIGIFDTTRVKVTDDEIRLMFAKDSDFKDQNSSGENANPDYWYFGIRFFAPRSDINGYKEGPQEVEDKIYKFTDDFSGTDKYGRNYSIVWFPAAHKKQEEWKYFGEDSSENHYIGWWHTIEWYKDETCVDSMRIRINLSNEECHTNGKPYYMNEAAIMWADM